MNNKAHKWRNSIKQITQNDLRIGSDVILVDDANAFRAQKIINNKPFKIDMSVAIIYDNGEAVFKIDMREYRIKAPAVIIVMAGQMCEVINYSEDLQGRAIVLSNAFTDTLFVGADGEYRHKLYFSMINNPLINFDQERNVFSEYYHLLKNIVLSPHPDFKIEAARYLTLAMFYGYSHMKHNITQHSKGAKRQDAIYRTFIDAVSKNYKRKREVRFYADMLCITAQHLSYVVKEVSGKTASEIIEDYVITEIKALLLSTNMTILQISDEFNFPSQSVFGKYFKRITGQSPKEYRNI